MPGAEHLFPDVVEVVVEIPRGSRNRDRAREVLVADQARHHGEQPDGPEPTAIDGGTSRRVVAR